MATIRFSKNWITVCGDNNIFVYGKSSKPLMLHRHINISALCTATTSKSDNAENEEADNTPGTSALMIVDSAFSKDDAFFTVVTTSKHLLIYNIQEDWKNDNAFVCHLPKGPTRVRFDNSNDIIVSDRAGSLRKFPLNKDESTELLGHISMILDFCLSQNGKHVLTVDRDEKLRVSSYPNTFIIESFHFGHKSFINSIVNISDDVVATAGGDSTIRLWNIKSMDNTSKDVKGPVRKLLFCPSTLNDEKLFSLSEGAPSLICFDYDERSNSLTNEFTLVTEPADVLVDVIFDPHAQALLCLGRRGIYSSEASNFRQGKLLKVEVDNAEELSRVLEHAKDAFPLSQLYKVTGFENMKTYTERKEQKIQRKRKFCAENNNNMSNDVAN